MSLHNLQRELSQAWKVAPFWLSNNAAMENTKIKTQVACLCLCWTVITAQPVRPPFTSPSALWIQHQFSTPALKRAVYSTRCLSKGLGAGAALYCMAKTNTDLFSLVGKTMVNSAEWNQLGIFVSFFFFYYVNAPVPTRHSHVGFSVTSSTSQNRQCCF